MRIIVAGASGLIGTALSSHLRSSGHDVVALVRRPAASPSESQWNPAEGRIDDAALRGVGRGDQPLRRRDRRPAVDARPDRRAPGVRGWSRPAPWLPRWHGWTPRRAVFLSQSASGYYGDAGPVVLRENAPAGSGTLARICVEWEAAAHEAPAGVRVVTPRTGVVLSRSGGALGRLMPLLRLGVGGPLGNGRQYWPWMTLPDVAGAFEFLLTSPVHGAVNLCAPESADVNALIAGLADALHRPALLRVPAPGAAAGDGTTRRRTPACQPADGTGSVAEAGFRWDTLVWRRRPPGLPATTRPRTRPDPDLVSLVRAAAAGRGFRSRGGSR